jgi:type I restriction enzyme S subunit
MLKEYDEYRPTPEAIWYDRVPVKWNSTKMRTMFTERITKVSDKEYPALSVGKMGVVPQLETAVKTDNGDNRKLICEGDFAINSRSDRKGSSGISDYTGSASLIITVLQPFEELNRRYYHYLLRSNGFVEEFYRNGHGLVSDLWTTKWQEMKNIFIPVPPKAEQDQIVRYLDWKVSEMNQMIHGMKKQIKLLKEYRENIICEYTHKGLISDRKMKPSEFPWIEGVPEGWSETRLKYVLTKLSRERKPEHELLICSNKGKVFFRGDSKMGLIADDDSIYQGVEAGDLLIHGMDTWHGAIAISEYDGMCTGVVHVCDTKENKRYIMYYLQSLAFKKVYKKITNGVRENTSDFRSWDKAGQINLLLPPSEEQNEIARILDEKNEQIENLIVSLEQEISYIEELKTKTIADVVTGQIDVRNVIIPEYTVDETDEDFDSDDVDDDSEESDEDEE